MMGADHEAEQRSLGRAGRVAFECGRPIETCCFAAYTPAWTAWRQGWLDAQKSDRNRKQQKGAAG